MRVLAVDIGTGTQDIYLFDSRTTLENGYKLVMPSPTLSISRTIRQATTEACAIALHGVMMGGGPSGWAIETHLLKGCAVYATPQAAKTINDDLEKVQSMGIVLVSDDEMIRLPDSVQRIELRDFDYSTIQKTFQLYGVDELKLDAIAVAAFDHGDAPPGVSDRQFRFDYLAERIQSENRLSAFAYLSENTPSTLTRLRSIAISNPLLPCPLVVMDTAPAAILGATFDQAASSMMTKIMVNVGNFHTIAFRLGQNGIEGLFEHHTGFLTRQKLEKLILKLADGTLSHAEVFEDQGHGAIIYSKDAIRVVSNSLFVTGPRRNILVDSFLEPHFAVPFGDMMICGCFGLLSATAEIIPEIAECIYPALKSPSQTQTAPWDIPDV